MISLSHWRQAPYDITQALMKALMRLAFLTSTTSLTLMRISPALMPSQTFHCNNAIDCVCQPNSLRRSKGPSSCTPRQRRNVPAFRLLFPQQPLASNNPSHGEVRDLANPRGNLPQLFCPLPKKSLHLDRMGSDTTQHDARGV